MHPQTVYLQSRCSWAARGSRRFMGAVRDVYGQMDARTAHELFHRRALVDSGTADGRTFPTCYGSRNAHGARVHNEDNNRGTSPPCSSHQLLCKFTEPTQEPNCISLVASVRLPQTLMHPCHYAYARRRSGHPLSRSSLVVYIRTPTTPSTRSGLRFLPLHEVRMLHLISLTLFTEAELLFSARS